jgi:hypothetical protein
VSADYLLGHMRIDLGFRFVRPAGFEPATRCLEGTFEESRDVAWYRSTSYLAAAIVAGCRGTSQGICPRWLPVWLPEIYLPSLMLEWTKTVSTMRYFGARPRA